MYEVFDTLSYHTGLRLVSTPYTSWLLQCIPTGSIFAAVRMYVCTVLQDPTLSDTCSSRGVGVRPSLNDALWYVVAFGIQKTSL
jgi:hypothetical protein